MRVLLLALVIAGCGQKQYIQSDFHEYVKSFQDNATKCGKVLDMSSLVIKFDTEGDLISRNVLGVCENNEVKINPEAWKGLDSLSREELIYHELGHCLLKRSHNSNLDNGYPVSIMYPNLFYSMVYKMFYNNYLTELFGC